MTTHDPAAFAIALYLWAGIAIIAAMIVEHIITRRSR
jgi:hypothetical protein